MNLYTKIALVALSYITVLIGGWFLGIDYAAVSCEQGMEFSSEGVRYVCTPTTTTGE